MSHVMVNIHHDTSSHSPQHMVSMHDGSDHYQSMTHDSHMSEPSSPESATFDDTDLLNSSVADVVTSQLAAAGPIGVAAAAAVATGRKRKRPHSFETNPSIRKRQQTRLLRKLKGTVDEYATRVGQQAVVLCACPGRPNPLFKVFGAAPLENCVKGLKPHILQSLENALAQQTPTPTQDNSGLFELPPLVIDGIPTPVDKMTQAQLRAFIPLMLKYSTGRGKPGWGRETTKPAWWPDDIPWQNVRSDTRSEEQKAKLSWTNALRMIVKNCYEFHGRGDLLPDFQDNGQTFQQVTTTHPMVHTLTNADGTLSLVQVDATGAIVSSYTEGSTQAEATQAVATLSEVSATTQGTPVTISISEMSHSEAAAQAAVATLAEATLADGGQLVLPEHAAAALASVGESPLNTSTMVTIPVHAAAAMMQIQNTQINSQGQYITTSIPQVAMAPHSSIHTVNASHNIQTQLVDSTNVDSSVPGASQAVEVVTYNN